ncbi:hypothetical protein CVT24_003708 [Panaeolus cyanescens]|uniref:Rhodopsin domain-containing protein n=1 Tax=Panaeolus cyanescens TaxID=181874 RepID=A0A409YXQ6_9AGAR|nr:hypothetical protein CVT24_003708 [Panaeolus cyanescens]
MSTQHFVSPHQNATPSPIARRALAGAFYGLALITTSIRLTHRFRIRRLWWDDFWASFALLNAVLVYTIFLLRPLYIASKSTAFREFGEIGNLLFYVLGLWCAKISMGVTLVRLLPPGRFRNVAKAVAVAFGGIGIVLAVHRVFGCNQGKAGPKSCIIAPNVGYVELSFDLASDAWLVGAPLYMMWGLKRRLPLQRWRLFSAAFACGIFSTIASVVHDIFVFRSEPLLMGLTAHIQLAVSIIVCNFLILATFLYRRVRNSGETTDRNHTTEPTDNEQGRPATVSTPQVPSAVYLSGGSLTTDITFTSLGSSMMRSASSYNTSSNLSSTKN